MLEFYSIDLSIYVFYLILKTLLSTIVLLTLK